MSGHHIATGLSAMLVMLMLFAAFTDLKSRTVSNALNLSIALLAIPFWIALGLPLWPAMAQQVGVALLVFAIFAGVFYIGAMGGGDVKMIAALSLWFPAGLLLQFIMMMSLVGAALTIAIVIYYKLRKLKVNPEVPYAVAIAAAGIWALHQQYINQFA
jgi:prepilin peptidase CpaA